VPSKAGPPLPASSPPFRHNTRVGCKLFILTTPNSSQGARAHHRAPFCFDAFHSRTPARDHPITTRITAAKKQSSPGIAPPELLRALVMGRDCSPACKGYHGKTPQSMALRRVIHRRSSCPNWDTFGGKCPLVPWGSDTAPRASHVVGDCVLRLSAPQRYRGAFFWINAKTKKPLASSGREPAKGFVVFKGTQYFQPQRKRKRRRLTVAECATNPALVRSYLDARVARRLPQAALYGPTAVKAVPSLPVP
jgi:hypothetical protein